MYALFEDDNLKTITLWVVVPSATMQKDLDGLNHLANTVSDSDFFDLTLLAITPYGIVGIRSFEHSIRLQYNCRNGFVDKTLQGCEWLVDMLVHESS